MKRVLLCAALIAWSGIASAVVYKWVDAQGKLQYGDRPPDGVHAEVVEMLAGHPAGRSPAAHSAAGNNPSTAAKAQAQATAASPGAPTDPSSVDDAVKQAVASDVAQTKEKQCTDAQDRYKKLIEGRRLYTTGNDGERQYLTSEQIDTERLNAKRELDLVCNSAT